MHTNIIKYLILLPIIIFSWSCRYDKLDLVDPASQNGLMQDTVSFSKDIVPIFVNNCNTSCHSGIYPAADLNLEPSYAYAQLTRTGSGYVNTINPENSRLYKSLISNMPPMGKLDEPTIELIAKWMQQAKNN
jgi:hypothetical protein